jgi:hypothetical protein
MAEIFADLQFTREQIDYVTKQLTSVSEAKKLGEITGTLTSKDLSLFDEMEASAVANLKSQITEETKDVWYSSIADLVNKGVLQGTVGTRILSEISNNSMNKFTEGVNNIRTARNTAILSTLEAEKNRQATSMNLDKSLLAQKYGWDLNAQTQLATAGTYADASKTASQYGLFGNMVTLGAGLASQTDWWKNLGKNTNTQIPSIDGSSWTTDASEPTYDWNWDTGSESSTGYEWMSDFSGW